MFFGRCEKIARAWLRNTVASVQGDQKSGHVFVQRDKRVPILNSKSRRRYAFSIELGQAVHETYAVMDWVGGAWQP